MNFRICRNDVSAFSHALSWTSFQTHTIRSGFYTSLMIIALIILLRTASPCRLFELEISFGKHSVTFVWSVLGGIGANAPSSQNYS